jgi:hypothetical protein
MRIRSEHVSLESGCRDDVLVVVIAGVLDARSAPLFTATVGGFWERPYRGLCVEIGDATIDHGGMPAVMAACRRARELGRDFTLRSEPGRPTPPVAHREAVAA